MRTLSILQWTAIGRGVPLGGCLQKSGLPPLKKKERKRERKKERKRKREREREKENCVISCAELSFLLVILYDITDTSCV